MLMLLIPWKDRGKYTDALLAVLQEVSIGKGSDRRILGWLPHMLGM